MLKITLHYITLSLFHTPFTPKVTSGASTKLYTTGSICQCKQMSFQLLFESTHIIKMGADHISIQIQLGVFGNVVNSPNGVWGEAPATNDFGAF